MKNEKKETLSCTLNITSGEEDTIITFFLRDFAIQHQSSVLLYFNVLLFQATYERLKPRK